MLVYVMDYNYVKDMRKMWGQEEMSRCWRGLPESKPKTL